MLVEFSVRNFRSLKDEQRLSMVATPIDDHETTHVFDSGVPGVDRLLRCAVLYGANAAGKSNLLKALDLVSDLVVLSAKESQRGEPIKVSPFGAKNQSEASTFEVVFVQDGVKYQFGFTANRNRIIEEWLYAFPEKRAQKWYYRKGTADSDVSDYEFGPSLRGPKQQWRSATRSNSLFLSTAVQLNAEQLVPVFEWFNEKLRVVLGKGDLSSNFSTGLVSMPERKKQLVSLLSNADIAIDDIEVIERPADEQFESLVKKVFPEGHQEAVLKEHRTAVRLKHKSGGGDFWLEMDDESQGTQKLFAYAGPILDVLEKGYVLVVDEMNNSLHPLLVRRIVEAFNDPKVNRKNAQLIFASHGISILSTECFRRDQIWFVEKDSSAATHVYPLVDFSPRKDAVLSKGYLQGRFGAIPFLSQGLIDGP